MNRIWPLAFITFKEGIRNRAIYGISLFALVLLSANMMLSGMMMRSAGKVAVDMALSTTSLSGVLLILFVGINLIAKDLDRRTIYMVLARPISRGEYIIGKFFGLVLLIGVAMLILGIFALLSIFLVKFTTFPESFDRVELPLILLALAFITMMLVLLSAISIFFASFSTTSFITLALTIIVYIIGNSLSDVKALVETPKAFGIEVSPVTVAMVQVAYYLFPNLSFFNIKLQAAHGIAVPLSYIFWTMVYGLVYTGLAIAFATLFFRKREFP